MNRDTIENMLNFLKEKEGRELPEAWFDSIKKLELVKELENHPDGTQYRYEGDLNLDKTNITKLPNDLHVDGHLSLRGCSQLTKLPDKLHVEGDLSLMRCSQLTKLPDKLYVKRTLDLVSCKQITKLPDDLHVTDSLIIAGTSIKEIPNNLYVAWDLFIAHTPLAKKYTDEQIYEMVESTGGKIEGKIIR